MSKLEKDREVVQEGELDTVKISGAEEQLIEKGRQKIMRPSVPFEDGRPVPIAEKSELLSLAMLLETCQTASVHSALRTVKNAAAGQGTGVLDADLAVAFAQMTELEPKSPLEALLVSQMVAVDTAIGRVMEKAMDKDKLLAFMECNINLATKLQRTFLQQIDALQKLRGKGQQELTPGQYMSSREGRPISANRTAKGEK